MFYKARAKDTGAMWDVWMTHHGGLYYLYLTCDTKTDAPGANNVSLATSRDGVHWTEVGPVIVRDEGVNRITFALSTNHGRAWGVTARVRRSRT